MTIHFQMNYLILPLCIHLNLIVRINDNGLIVSVCFAELGISITPLVKDLWHERNRREVWEQWDECHQLLAVGNFVGKNIR